MDIPSQNSDAYVHYEFVCVRCKCCGAESNPFVYKEHLNADETLAYIVEITGFELDRLTPEEHAGSTFVNSGTNTHRGGVICPECNENKLKEVV